MAGPSAEEVIKASADWWATEISEIKPGIINLRGHRIAELIENWDFVSVIWLMTKGTAPTKYQSRLLTAAMVASVDHGPQAPSIASARMAITCGIGINNAVATGINLLGDTHGGAGQQCVELLQQIRSQEMAGIETQQAISNSVSKWKERSKFIPGFGHRFHPVDPRRRPLLDLVDEAVANRAIEGHFIKIARHLEQFINEGRDKPIPMNIDGATAIIYAELGIEPELARGLFCLSRGVGILSHAWEESKGGKRIKGPMPTTILPSYIGPEVK
jgi:citrate synthase